MKSIQFYKRVILIFIIIINYSSFSQNGKITLVTYKMQNTFVTREEFAKNGTSVEDLKWYDDYIAAFEQIEFELLYDSNKSIFKLVDKLELIEDFNYKKVSLIVGNNVNYKNNSIKEKLFYTDNFGEIFNVILSFDEYKWEITTETKIIDGYKCYKATSTKEKYDRLGNKNGFYYPYAWFTPEIPSSFGPAGLDGLPGLVLEGSVKGAKFVYYASKINLDYITKKDIERPTCSNEISQAEYLDLSLKKIKEINR